MLWGIRHTMLWDVGRYVGHDMRRLEDIGFRVGLRLLEMLCFREKSSKRDVRLLDVLKFVHSTLWKYLFGRQARDLEQSNTVSHLFSIGLLLFCHTLDLSVSTSINQGGDMRNTAGNS